MPVSTPTTQQIADIAAWYKPSSTEADIADFRRIMQGTLAPCRRLDALREPTLPVVVPSTPGHRPDESENPYNGPAA